jgi:asparagine synthase (glutamine-hydrolysing)
MSVWAGYVGPGNADELRRLLGAAAQIHAGAGFGLGLRCRGDEPASFSVRTDGGASVQIGLDLDTASGAVIGPSGPKLLLASDPFGLHCVYTTWVDRVFWFASDLRVLEPLGATSRRLDAAALHGYLCLSYVPTPKTMIEGISSLAAGEQLVIRAGATLCRENRAAWCEQPPLAISEDEAVVELRARLRNAVGRRLGNASQVGVFLSGGLDSSLIAALLVELGAKLQLFTLDFGPPYDAELAYARRVADHLRQPLHVVPARPADIRAALLPTAAALDQPFGDGVTVPLYLLGEAAARQVDTIFNGEGGDQLFGGWANKPMIAAEAYGTNGYNREAAYRRTYHRLLGLTTQFYTAQALGMVDDVDVGSWIRPALEAPGFCSLLHRLRAANLWLKGAQNIAPRARQLAAAHGLAMHAPFFDHSLTHWTFSLPPEWFLRGACEKYLLKRAAEAYLPAHVVWREKRGMGVPTTEWCLGPLRREIRRWLSPRRLQCHGWFKPDAVRRLGRGEELPSDLRQRRVGELLWLLLMLHVWLEVRGQKLTWPTSAEKGAAG